MFLFPWLDWGIDISDFEKIDFLAHEPYLAFLAPWKGAFLGPQVEFRPHSGGVEYSTCLKIFIFWKYNVSAFKWRVERFSTTLKEKKSGLFTKKTPKKPPSVGFWLARLYMAGNRKKCVKKVQNTTFSALFGGGLLQLVQSTFLWKFPQKRVLGRQNLIFCDYVWDRASGPKTFLGSN